MTKTRCNQRRFTVVGVAHFTSLIEAIAEAFGFIHQSPYNDYLLDAIYERPQSQRRHFVEDRGISTGKSAPNSLVSHFNEAIILSKNFIFTIEPVCITTPSV